MAEITLTESSYRQLKEELQHLKTVKRAEITEAIRKARAFGDLSENFEYHAARREQGILNGRIQDIERTLQRARVVPDDGHQDEETAGLGSVVTVRDLDMDEELEYVLVDPVQADPVNDRISIESPIGKELLGKKIGATVEVKTPTGKVRLEILAIRKE